jgi:hypothetical protein
MSESLPTPEGDEKEECRLKSATSTVKQRRLVLKCEREYDQSPGKQKGDWLGWN